MNPPTSLKVSLIGTHAVCEVNALSTRKPDACLCIASGPLALIGARYVR